MLISNENELKAFSEEREQVEARMKGVSKIDAELRSKLEEAVFLVVCEEPNLLGFWISKDGEWRSVDVRNYSLDFANETLKVEFDRVDEYDDYRCPMTMDVPFDLIYKSARDLFLLAEQRRDELLEDARIRAKVYYEAEAKRDRYNQYLKLKQEFESEKSV